MSSDFEKVYFFLQSRSVSGYCFWVAQIYVIQFKIMVMLSFSLQFQVAEIRKVLKDLKFRIVEIVDPDAIVEGGDVLFTGLYESI